MAKFEVKGLENMTQNLESISQEAQGPAVRQALRKAATVIRDKARGNAIRVDDVTTREAIYKNIAVVWGKKETQQTGDPTMRVGVMGGAGRVRLRKSRKTGLRVNPNDSNPGGDTRYWRMVEFGTRYTAARPFLRPAMNQVGEEAVTAFAQGLDKIITKAIKKGNS